MLRITGSVIAIAALAGAAGLPEYTYKVVRTYPHDPNAFTQGLEYHGGELYEGTGLPGRSSLRKVKLETGEVLKQVQLPPAMFGEGITIWNRQVFQLTWQHQSGFVYDPATFALLRRFSYVGEGWGLSNDGRQIYMTDGNSEIRIWDPATLTEKKRLKVREGTREITALNELECVRGELYANVWHSERIARISPIDGSLLGWIDLTGILPPQDRSQVDVLNGIAYDAARDRLFVTGKLWPKLFEIRVMRKGAAR